MGKPGDIDARRFLRAARERLNDGLLLLRGGRAQGSLYLTGYAVECALKALLLSRTSPGERAEVLAQFRGTRAHNFEWLRSRLAAQGVHPPPAELGLLTLAGVWQVDLRYNPTFGDPEEARDFAKTATLILAWVERSF